MSYSPDGWRLLLSPPADGAANMAVDEAILLAVAAGTVPPTLRLYAWEPPCLSLGVAQPAREVDDVRRRTLGWDLVRRPTGGRALLHSAELTYSICAPLTEPLVRGGVLESYRRLSSGLLKGLEFLGVHAWAQELTASSVGRRSRSPLCFDTASAYEIVVGGGAAPRKLLGSAQVRKLGVVLQHGALPLSGDVASICDGLSFESEAVRCEMRGRLAQRAVTLAEAAGRTVSWEEAATALIQGMVCALGIELKEGSLTPLEQADSARLRRDKYAAAAWTFRL